MNQPLPFLTGRIPTAAGEIPQVSDRLSSADIRGTIGVRWDIHRDTYSVPPGIYGVGKPDEDADVFVTANYKFSFDMLRKNLKGMNAWILVLNTKGINVWCAAGKGTFGTAELVNRIKDVSLSSIVRHRRLILPQLGATGVSAYKVREETGFNVTWGPVRADDIPAFISMKYKATKEMRRVRFNLWDRMKQIPVDFVYGKYYLFGAFIFVFVVSGLSRSGYSIPMAADKGLTAILNILFGYMAGIVLTPLLLPYIPVKRFALKGMLMGIAVSFLLLVFHRLGDNLPEILAWFLMIAATSSYIAMNFTGSSTFTSLSGVRKEMKFAVPVQITFSLAGIVLLIIGKLV
jgi:hypothetical protein